MDTILSASKIDRCIVNLNGAKNRITLDGQSRIYMDEIFTLLKRIAPTHENSTWELWLHADRGPIEDFGNLEDMLRNEQVESEEDWKAWWLEKYPDETVWFKFGAVEDSNIGYRAIYLKDKLVLKIDARRDAGCIYDASDFTHWLVESLKECITALEDGTYNERIQEEVPLFQRFGKIQLKDYWDTYPKYREDFFSQISREDVQEFVLLAKAQNEKPSGRLEAMTANDFYNFCALGYAANNYDGVQLTPKKQYFLHADGRDDELHKIDPDSPEAFHDWLMRGGRGGHPWEICSGGNSTHIDLYVIHDEAGYYLYVAGSSWSRTIETVKIYLALHRSGLPVIIHQGKLLAARLDETEQIGIVPKTMLPVYCKRHFPDEDIITYMHLPSTNQECIAEKVCWRPIVPVKLIQEVIP